MNKENKNLIPICAECFNGNVTMNADLKFKNGQWRVIGETVLYIIIIITIQIILILFLINQGK